MSVNRLSSFFAMLVCTILPCRGPALAEDFNLEAAKSAAEKGDAEAQYDLARRYEKGHGMEQDPAKAAEYMRKAADLGYAYAQTDLGSYYAKGLGVKKDLQEAVRWYDRAANHGDALGQYC